MSGQTTVRQSTHTIPYPTTRSSSRHVASHRQPLTFQTRYRLVVGAVLIALLAIYVGSQTVSAYHDSAQIFQHIVQDNGVRVAASEQALQHIAGASTAAADFSSTAEGSANHAAALTAIYDEFRQFRDNMFTLRANLDSAESAAYVATEHAVYDQFWPQIGIVIAAQQVGDRAAARAAFVKADGTLETAIVPALQQLEAANFAAMKAAEQSGSNQIESLSWQLGVVLFLLAGALTAFSIWLRKTVRRYLTPGLDAAAVLGWLVLIGVFSQMIGLPGSLKSMVEDAYYSVTASSRVLQAAAQGNRAESGALLDVDHATRWQHDFDADKRSVELLLCGTNGCLLNMFLAGYDRPSQTVVARAKTISLADRATIGGIVPLIANVTYSGEGESLEAARIAYNDYLVIDGRTRGLIAANQIDAALVLNTGTKVGQSNEAYGRFVIAMEREKAINRDVFDQIWRDQQTWLTTNQIALGLAAPALLIALLAAGVYHRYREL